MKPQSPAYEINGLRHFARMLDKIRLQEKGELDLDYHDKLGRGADGRLLQFLRINYDDLRARVRQGGADEEILEWCYTHGHRLDENDITIWNGFISKLGWNDAATDYLASCKKEAGLSHRDDIQTLFQLFDIEEGRKP